MEYFDFSMYINIVDHISDVHYKGDQVPSWYVNGTATTNKSLWYSDYDNDKPNPVFYNIVKKRETSEIIELDVYIQVNVNNELFPQVYFLKYTYGVNNPIFTSGLNSISFTSIDLLISNLFTRVTDYGTSGYNNEHAWYHGRTQLYFTTIPVSQNTDNNIFVEKYVGKETIYPDNYMDSQHEYRITYGSYVIPIFISLRITNSYAPPSIIFEPKEETIAIGETFTVNHRWSDDSEKYISLFPTSNNIEVSPRGYLQSIVGATPGGKAGTYIVNVCSIESYPSPVTPESVITVTTYQPTIPVTGITINPKTITLQLNEEYVFTATVTPSNATDPSVTWYADPEYMSIDETGAVVAKKVGTTKVRVTSNSSQLYDTATVTILPIQLQQIEIDKELVDLEIGESVSVTHTLVPSNATEQRVNWVIYQKYGGNWTFIQDIPEGERIVTYSFNPEENPTDIRTITITALTFGEIAVQVEGFNSSPAITSEICFITINVPPEPVNYFPQADRVADDSNMYTSFNDEPRRTDGMRISGVIHEFDPVEFDDQDAVGKGVIRYRNGSNLRQLPVVETRDF